MDMSLRQVDQPDVKVGYVVTGPFKKKIGLD